ncbi:hypothetical protein PMAYCL1PPCAC_00517, partial [Pristionchus mayeri]
NLRAVKEEKEEAERKANEREKKVADLTIQLEGERIRSNDKVAELELSNRDAREAKEDAEGKANELEKRVKYLASQQDSKRARNSGLRSDLEKANALAKELTDERDKTREEMTKLENNLQSAYAAVNGAETRATHAESLLDSKRGVLVAEKKAFELEERRSNDLAKQLEEERVRVNDLMEELRRRNNEHVKDRERIDELTIKLVQYEAASMQLQNSKLQQKQFNVSDGDGKVHTVDSSEGITDPPFGIETQQPTETAEAAAGKTATAHTRNNATNILHMIAADSPEAMYLDSALSRLGAEFEKFDKEKQNMILDKEIQEYFDCGSCGVSLPHGVVLDHFFTEEHIEMVRAHNGSVSITAVKYWLSLMER